MWTRLIALIIKELLSVWRDKKSRFVLVVPPLVQLFVFSHAATYDVTNVRIAVFNQDAGAPSHDLIARFEDAPDFTRILYLRSETEIVQVMDSKEAVPGRAFGGRFFPQPAGRHAGSRTAHS